MDPFAPYSFNTHGNLEDYLKEKIDGRADNHFFGFEPYFEIKKLGLLIPNYSYLRINRNPLPDIGCIVSEDFMLKGTEGEYNMSLVSKEGVFDPAKNLIGNTWSIYNLDFKKLYSFE